MNGKEKCFVDWFDKVVMGEVDNIRWLVWDGVRWYVLVMNILSFGRVDMGVFDQLNRLLD